MREDVKWTFCCSNAFLCFQAIVNKMADNEVLQEEAKSVKSNTVTVLVENETPVIVSEEANGSDKISFLFNRLVVYSEFKSKKY